MREKKFRLRVTAKDKNMTRRVFAIQESRLEINIHREKEEPTENSPRGFEMVSTLVLALILAAISIAIVAEVLAAYEKHALRREMTLDLDRAEEESKKRGG